MKLLNIANSPSNKHTVIPANAGIQRWGMDSRVRGNDNDTSVGALIAIGFMLISIVSGCQKLFPVDSGVGTGRGIVRRIDFDHHQITLSHGTVGMILHPMTYAYEVKSDSMMKNLNVGDSVNFSIEEPSPGAFVVQSLKKIVRGTPGKGKTSR